MRVLIFILSVVSLLGCAPSITPAPLIKPSYSGDVRKIIKGVPARIKAHPVSRSEYNLSVKSAEYSYSKSIGYISVSRQGSHQLRQRIEYASISGSGKSPIDNSDLQRRVAINATMDIFGGVSKVDLVIDPSFAFGQRHKRDLEKSVKLLADGGSLQKFPVGNISSGISFRRRANISGQDVAMLYTVLGESKYAGREVYIFDISMTFSGFAGGGYAIVDVENGAWIFQHVTVAAYVNGTSILTETQRTLSTATW